MNTILKLIPWKNDSCAFDSVLVFIHYINIMYPNIKIFDFIKHNKFSSLVQNYTIELIKSLTEINYNTSTLIAIRDLIYDEVKMFISFYRPKDDPKNAALVINAILGFDLDDSTLKLDNNTFIITSGNIFSYENISFEIEDKPILSILGNNHHFVTMYKRICYDSLKPDFHEEPENYNVYIQLITI